MNTSQFINSAYQSSLREIALGKLASKKAGRTEVRTFAELLIKEHGTANQELEKMAREKNITLRSELKEGDLIDLEGEAVDEKYLSHVLESHRSKIGMYEKAQASSDEQIRAFSLKQLPQLKNHLSRALYLNKNIKRE
jgi:putative membrane protein